MSSSLFLVAAAALAVFAAGWWLSRPMAAFWRWLFRAVMLLLVTGLTLPPAAIDWLRDQLSMFVPLARDLSNSSGADFWAHLLLFTLVSGLLFWFRLDMAKARLAGLLIALAFVMEGLQLLVDGRFASWGDVGVNLLGVALGAGVSTLGRWRFQG